ncbi:MAG TPA: DMT family transporter [Aliidongia sp.]|uniref:DMT family transporter n=1 Tax=Aliidongia sp. TaxID=1914230 RepID=UPI002DDCD5CF|nr:DMT family transporter [Aliidongia sp.]HEV2676005.1 DMT family transporter [Aliidongia sp.]
MSLVLPRPASAHQNGAGIASMLLAVLLYGVMDALIKYQAERYPVIEVVFFRSLFALLPLGVLILRGGGWKALATRQPRLQAARAVIGFVSVVCFFEAFALMPLADVVAIGFAAPLFITALSVPLLGEQVGWRRWSAVLAGFAGVLIMVRPGSSLFGAAAGIALLATLSYALSIITIRRLSATDGNAPTVASFTCLSVLISGLVLPFYWVMPTPADWLMLIAAGVLGGAGQIAFTRAFALAPPVIVAPFDYANMLLATVLGFLVWGDVPTLPVFVGAAIVIASGLYIVYREAIRRGA